jgi:hypothetical protein
MRTTDTDLVAHVLDRGANPNAPEQDGATPFMLAIGWDRFATARLLADRGANVNAQDAQGRTVLMWAASQSNAQNLDAIMSFHPDVNRQDKDGETALTLAADRGNGAIVRRLLAAGAQPRLFHIILKPQDEKLSAAQQWALAVGALYAQYNGFSHRSLMQDPGTASPLSKQLVDEWGVKDKATLVTRVLELQAPASLSRIAVGQSMDLARTRRTDGWLSVFSRAWALGRLDWRWWGKLNVAWNACRAANLIREGVTVGYIKEDESWPLLMQNARRAQRAYTSWREMNDSFLDSREIWAGERDPDFRACADLLLNPKDPNSPWNQLAWNTDLGK